MYSFNSKDNHPKISLLRKNILLLISFIPKCRASLKKWVMDIVPKKENLCQLLQLRSILSFGFLGP
jgi:hypothetical protein